MTNKGAENFYNAFKDDPQAIIDWCRKEIEAYEELIKIIEKNV